MKDKPRWCFFAAAVILMAVNWLTKDRLAPERLSPADFWPVLILSAVVFLVKIGGASPPFSWD